MYESCWQLSFVFHSTSSFNLYALPITWNIFYFVSPSIAGPPIAFALKKSCVEHLRNGMNNFEYFFMVSESAIVHHIGIRYSYHECQDWHLLHNGISILLLKGHHLLDDSSWQNSLSCDVDDDRMSLNPVLIDFISVSEF